MYVDCGGLITHEIKNIQFSPEVDLTGSTCPICEITVDIKSETDFSLYSWLVLFDEDDNVWCNYLVRDQKRLDPYFVRVTGRSQLCLVESAKIESALYQSSDSQTTTDLATALFGGLYYTLDSSLAGLPIVGYLEKGNIRDAIHKLLYSMGAYVLQGFSTTMDILPLSNSMKLIPYKRTFMTPSYENNEYYSRITMRIYEYTEIQGEPSTTQEYITVNGHYYEVGGGYTYLDNPNPISGGPSNILEADSFLQVNSDYMLTLNRLALLFKDKATIDCLNEREFLPGQKVCAYMGKKTIICGWIQKADFKFGHSVRSTLSLIGCEEVSVGEDIIAIYTDAETGDELYREDENYFPEGWTYTYTPKPTVDVFLSDTVRVVARPTVTSFTGTVLDREQTLTIPCNIELEYITDRLQLSVYGADDITESTTTDSSSDTIYIIELQGGGSTSVNESSWEVTCE